VPEAPKKLLAKPDHEKFKAELNKLKEEKDSLYQQKGKLLDEQRFLIKSNSENKKSGFTALSKYGLELKEKLNLKKILFDKIHKLEEQQAQIEKKLKDLKDVNGNLRGSKDLEAMSVEHLKSRILNLEQTLSSANLDKKQ
jgi:regulator of replication initiation timing